MELDLGSILMAKRKLSDDQRLSLRRDIAAKLSAGVPRTTIVKGLSSKYKISPISMRWYLRTQPTSGAAKPGASQTAPPAAGGTPLRKPDAGLTAALGCGTSGSAHHGKSLVDILNEVTPKKLKRILEAKKLIPKLAVHRRQESKLKGQIQLLEKKLESEQSKVRGVEAQIKRLAGF